MIEIVKNYLKTIVAFLLVILTLVFGFLVYKNSINNSNTIEIIVTPERYYLKKEIKMIRKILEDNRKSYVIKQMEFPKLMEYVSDSSNAIGVAAISFNDIRKNIFQLSDSYGITKIGMLHIINYNKNKLIRIGMQNKTTFITLINNNKHLIRDIIQSDKYEIIYSDSLGTLFNKLQNNTIDILICNELYANYKIKECELPLVFTPLKNKKNYYIDYLVFALSKDVNVSLLKAINKAIKINVTKNQVINNTKEST